MDRSRHGGRNRSEKRNWEQQGLVDNVRSGHALRAGDRAPTFRLNDRSGQPYTLSDMLRRGPVVLSFLDADGIADGIGDPASAHGSWMDRILATGAAVLIVSPVAPSETAAPAPSDVPVLHDVGSRVAGAYGLPLSPDPSGLRDPADRTGARFPSVPATFVVDQRGEIAISLTHACLADAIVATNVLSALEALHRCKRTAP